MRLIVALFTFVMAFSTVTAQHIEWQDKYGDPALNDYCEAMAQMPDGGFVLAGWQSAPSQVDILVIRIDSAGNGMMMRTYGTATGGEYANDVCVVSDGSVVLCGQAPSQGVGEPDAYLLKLDANLDTVWTRRYGGTGQDRAYAVIESYDGGYCFVGMSEQGATVRGFISKVDTAGNEKWTTYLGAAGETSTLWDIIQAPDSSIVVVGQIDTIGGGKSNVLIAKLNRYGYPIWTKQYGGTISNVGSNIAQSVCITSEGDYLLTGFKSVDSPVRHNNMLLMKVSESGDSLWSRLYGDTMHFNGISIAAASDSTYAIAGEIWAPSVLERDIVVMAVDAFGDSLWMITVNTGGTDLGRDIIALADGRFVVAGRAETSSIDMYAFEIAPSIVTGINDQPESILPNGFWLSQNWPNPFNPSTAIEYTVPFQSHVSIKVFNVFGQDVATIVDESQLAGTHLVYWDGRTRKSRLVSTGVYFYQLKVGNYVETKKMLLMK